MITDLPSHWAYARAIAVNPDTGYIYVAGYFTENGVNSPGVLRYTSNGTLDTTFGGDGSVAFPNNGGGAYGAALQTDGKLVAVGTSISGGVASSFVIRLNVDGTFDSTFGPDGNGIVVNSFVSGINNPRSVVVQPDGEIVVSGGQGPVFVARYTSYGRLEDVAPSLAIADVTKAEGKTGTTPFIFQVTLSRSIGSPVTVQYATVNGSAGTQKPGVDYTATSGTLTIPAGKTTGSITVSVKGDTTAEPDETFWVRIWNASPGTTIEKFSATGTILNDDGAVKTASVSPASPTGSAATASAGSDLAMGTPTSTSVSVAPVTSPTPQPAVETSQPAPRPAATTATPAATDRSLAELSDLDLSLDLTLAPVLDDLLKV